MKRRTETLAHRNAKRDRAEKYRCPACQRKAALSWVRNDYGTALACRWCGHVKQWHEGQA